jgi:formate dehydrogenase accessory protein FdhE
MAVRSADPAARIARARALVASHPAAAEPLTFFADLIALQQSIVSEHNLVLEGRSSFTESLDFDAAADALPSLFTGLHRIAPAAVIEAVDVLLEESRTQRRHLVHSYWCGERDGDPRLSFIVEALLQPFAERVAASFGSAPGLPVESGVSRTGRIDECPICGDRPVVAVLRDAAHGSRRSFICGFCLDERAAPRLGCVRCGEAEFARLAVHRADEFPSTRVDACETCHAYLKTIDLTNDAHAIPIVDDVATVALDLWAREQGYQRLRPNLLRL